MEENLPKEELNVSYILLNLKDIESFLTMLSHSDEEIDINDIQILSAHFSTQLDEVCSYLESYL